MNHLFSIKTLLSQLMRCNPTVQLKIITSFSETPYFQRTEETLHHENYVFPGSSHYYKKRYSLIGRINKTLFRYCENLCKEGR